MKDFAVGSSSGFSGLRRACCVLALFLAVPWAYGRDIDHCAADAKTATYRTGVVDPAVAAVPADLQRRVRTGSESAVRELALRFRKETRDDYRLVKIIHDWISTTICYDYNLLFGLDGQGSRNPLEFLKSGRTTCGGYTDLFLLLARLAGLEAVRIDGLVKTYYFTKGRVAGDHTWNAVRIGSVWYLVDTTYDATGRYLNGKFTITGEYRDTYLFVNPEFYIYLNYPRESRWQLIKKPLTYEEYEALPIITYWFFRYGLALAGEVNPRLVREFRERENSQGKAMSLFEYVETAGGKVTVAMRAPRGIRLLANVRDGADKKYPDHVVGYYDNGVFYAEFSAPARGGYFAKIFAAPEGEKIYQPVYSFELIEKKAAGPLLPELGRVCKNYTAVQYGLSLRAGDPAAYGGKGYVHISVSHPEDVVLYTHYHCGELTSNPALILKSYLPGRTDFYYTFAKAGRHRVEVLSKKAAAPDDTAEGSLFFDVEVSEGSDGVLWPERVVLFHRTFAENGYELLKDNLASAKPDGVYEIRIKAPDALQLRAQLNKIGGSFVSQRAWVVREGDAYTVSFTAPGPGEYRGRIYRVTPRNVWVTICEFKLAETTGAGPLLPLKR